MTIEAFVPLYPRGEHSYSLGRHVLHDSASRDYDARELVKPVTLVSTLHKSVVEPWDQGQIGQCTAEAALGLLMTEPFHNGRWQFTGTGTTAETVQFYRDETRIDDRNIPGHYEPDDTGSTGLWSMKVLKRRGIATSYHHVFNWTTLLRVLMDHPVSMGISWFGSMFNPDARGVVTFDSSIDEPIGGHQLCVVGFDLEHEELIFRNSWRIIWGVGGYGRISFTKAQELLYDFQGDVIYPVLKG